MDARASFASRLLLGALIAAWTAAISLLLLHRIVVSNDSLSNYGHVWLITEHLREHHSLPWKLPALLHGDGQAYPYGFLPWTLAALLRPLLGDWVSTLFMAVGAGGVIAGTFAALPELRRPLPAACALANPVLVEMFVLFQLPFAWAAALFLWAAWAFRRERMVAATLLAGAAQATHAAVLMPITAVAFLLAWNIFPGRRRGLAMSYAVSVAAALPAAAIVLASPVVSDASRTTVLANFAETVGWRALVFIVPAALAWLTTRRPRGLWPAAILFLALNPLLVPVRHTMFAWGLFFREPDGQVAAFTRTPAFEPGATYRVLRAGDGKVGMYQILKAGGRLDSEFFPESIDRRSWPSQQDYAAFLSKRRVDYVLIFTSYHRRFSTNEESLLNTMSGSRCASVAAQTSEYTAYRVQPSDCEVAR
ncbi:MAG: hypothetical protein IT301_07395 [Dehalococcoidia bacterium]|nr:hypothetical protein [Dehalococcoidia bacterium]